MNNIAAKIVLTSVLATSSTAVLASDKWEKESMDAWLDGKAETTLLLNSNLNSFDINTDVENQVVTLSGSVNNDLEKSLAEELVTGLDGVKKVNNELSVVNEGKKETDWSLTFPTRSARGSGPENHRRDNRRRTHGSSTRKEDIRLSCGQRPSAVRWSRTCKE